MKDKDIFRPQILIFDEFKDLELINAVSQGWDNRWTYMKSGGTEAKLWVFTTPRMQFSWVGYDNGIMIESSPPIGTVQLSFVRTQGICNIHNKNITNFELVILYGGEETNYFANNSSEIFSLVFEKQFFDQSFYEFFGIKLDTIRSNYRLEVTKKEIDIFILSMKYWLDYFQTEESKTLSKNIYFNIEENIVEYIFSLVHIDKSISSQKQLNIKDARMLLKDNIFNLYSINNLVNDLGVNARTLQHNFKIKLGITPIQYLKNLRLNAIRQELLNADPEHTEISIVALKYGFFNPSYFSKEYKKLFGKTPTQTLLSL